MIDLDLTERIKIYAADQLEKWRNRESRAWLELLPQCERDRKPRSVDDLPAKYCNQPAYHFAEVLEMRALEGDGLSWRYENYRLGPPWNSGDDEVIVQAFGEPRLEQFWRLAGRYLTEPKSLKLPDIFAYDGVSGKPTPVRFVETKRSDSLSYDQALGLALIDKVLGAKVELVRYVPRPVDPRRYVCSFKPVWS